MCVKEGGVCVSDGRRCLCVGRKEGMRGGGLPGEGGAVCWPARGAAFLVAAQRYGLHHSMQN